MDYANEISVTGGFVHPARQGAKPWLGWALDPVAATLFTLSQFFCKMPCFQEDSDHVVAHL
jgi:hypothetical protein